MLNDINSFLWFQTTLIVSLVGVYLLIYNNLSPFKLLNKCKKISKDSIKLLNLSLGGKIGVGSISGIAISIIIGGKGTIFWIWISSIVLTIFTYLETKAGILFKERDFGGPSIYIKNKLNNKFLSIIYSILIIFTFIFSFILIQSNTIIISLSSTFNIKIIIIVILLLISVYFSINKGIRFISKITSYLVPFMGAVYIFIGLIVIITNINTIPNIIKDILIDAFTFKSIINLPVIIGFQRSIFSNESGMGTTSMIVALSNTSDYKKEAFVQILGNYFISLIVCTISALLILTSDYNSIGITNINGIEIINYAFNYHFGNIGIYLSSLIILLFAFSTIITSFLYGDITIKHLFHNKKNTFTKIIVIIVIVFSSIIDPKYIWNIVDISVSLTTLINIYALIKMRKELKESS